MPRQRSLNERYTETKDKLDKLDLRMKIEELRKKIGPSRRRGRRKS